MPYTIKTASFANAENTAAVINTEEVAHVLISFADTPLEWANMLAWQAQDNSIRAYGEGSAYKAQKAREAETAARKAQVAQKLAKLGLTVDDVRAIME